MPLDEALARVVVDLSGRPYMAYRVKIRGGRVGSFDTDLPHEFYQAFVNQLGMNLHMDGPARRESAPRHRGVLQGICPGHGPGHGTGRKDRGGALHEREPMILCGRNTSVGAGFQTRPRPRRAVDHLWTTTGFLEPVVNGAEGWGGRWPRCLAGAEQGGRRPGNQKTVLPGFHCSASGETSG